MHNKILIILCFFLILSCNKSQNYENIKKINEYDENIYEDFELFDIANLEIKEKEFDLALENLNKIEILFPNSPYASKAKLLSAYINFLDGEFERTKAISENFIKYYPGNRDIVYAYYLDAMTDYIAIKKPSFDQLNSIKAKNKFIFINNAYPNSLYKKDIILKLNIVNNSLASNLMEIGKYYQKKNNSLAALSYYLEIFNDYQETQVIDEVLYLITKVYYELGEQELAIKYASIHGYNYSESKWYNKTYKFIKNIDDKEYKEKKWYNYLNPIKLIKGNKLKKEKDWYEPKKPEFKLF